MAKVIRPTYPVEFSIGLLLLIFALSSFLSTQIFKASWHDVMDGNNAIFGMMLVGVAVVIMAMILWEEFLFPIKFIPTADQVVFRNHRTKLKTQLLIYCAIPAIFGFVYFKYEVNHVRFFIWVAVCTGLPVVGKLISGLKNYNDFLKLTYNTIEYKNNKEAGTFDLKDVKHIILIKDETNVLHKIELSLVNNNSITIDLDEMELEAYFELIDKSMSVRYKELIKPIQ
jgi:hypothetical protein